jgi:hypothetical protein
VIPPGTSVVAITADAGVYGANVSTGNLSPGQALPVSVHLKPKGSPASLAGATLKLDAKVTAKIQQPSYEGNWQTLTVAFPPNYCKTPAVTTGSRSVAAPTGRSAPK